jgi:perosamine synthetase
MGPYDILLSSPDLRGNEQDYIRQCISDNWISSAGPFVGEFEEKISKRLGRKHAVATSSGTAAIELGLIGSGIKSGDKVVVPDWTFAATASAVAHIGAEIILADVTRDGFGLDPVDLEKILQADRQGPSRITAAIAVHPFGHPADMDALMDVCNRYGIAMIEDAAGAIGSSYKGKPVGGHGKVSAISFNGNKTLTTGGGGMVLTDNDDIAEVMRLHSVNSQGPNYRYKVIGYNHRMTNLAAGIGLAQLERLDEMLESKKRISDRYTAYLEQSGCLETIPHMPWATSNCWMYCGLAKSEAHACSLIEFMDKNRVQVRIFWRSLASEPAFQDIQRSDLKNCREISGRVVALPCSSHLTEEQQENVIALLGEWHKTVGAHS